MKRTYAFANAAIASLVLSMIQCSSESTTKDDSEEGGAAGTTGGKGGSAGTSAGSGGTAGKGGSAGTSGKGGSSGSSAGTAGAGKGGGAGVSGAAGAGGDEGGMGGEPTSGGSAGEPDSGGAGGIEHAGGSGGDAGGSGGDPGGGGEGGLPEPAAGDTCDTATFLTSGTYADHSTVGFEGDYSFNQCFTFATPGPDRVYRVAIPSGNRLTFEATPVSTFDPILAVVAAPASNCVAAPSCLVARDLGSKGGAETVMFANDSPAVQSVYVVVDGYLTELTGGQYDLDVGVTATPDADLCVNALPLGEGTEIAGTLAIAGVDNDYTIAPCIDGEQPWHSPGPDIAYKLEIPAGSTLEVTINPDEELDPAIFLVPASGPSCDRNTCLAGADGGYQGASETLSYTNETGAAQSVYLIVDSFTADFSTPGPFHLDVSLTP